jgi:hypothetical protein
MLTDYSNNNNLYSSIRQNIHSKPCFIGASIKHICREKIHAQLILSTNQQRQSSLLKQLS